MFNLIVLIVIDIVSKVLFNSLVKLFYLSVDLRIKSYRKLVIHFKSYYKCYKESKSKSHIFIYYKLV